MEFLSQLHPRIVHFPVAFFIFYFLFELSGVILKKEYLTRAALILLAIGVVTALFAVLSGNQAQTAANTLIDKGSNLSELIEVHQEYATVTLFYFSALLFLRVYLVIKNRFKGNIRYLFLLFGLTGCYLIYETGIHGGDLVFKYGLGTQLFGK